MADDPSKQVEIDVALRDTASSVLKEIAKNIDEVSRKLVETGRKGSEAFEKIRRGGNEASESTKKTTEHVSKLSEEMKKLAHGMSGPFSLAAGLVVTAVAIEKFIARAATSRLQLQMMTTDIGLSKTAISEMQQVLSRKGIIDPGEQKRILASFGGEAMDLKTKGVYSEFWDRLQKFDPKFATSFKESVDRGDIYDAFKKAKNMYADLMKAGNPDLAHYFATETMHMTASTLENWDEYTKGLVKSVEIGEKEAKKAAQIASDLAKSVSNDVNRAIDATMKKLLELEAQYGKTGQAAKDVVGGSVLTPNATVRDRFPGPDAFKGQPGGTGPSSPSGIPNILITPRPDLLKKSSADDEGAIPSGATPIQFTRASLTLQEIDRTEKESTGILRDILDALTLPIGPQTPGVGPTFRRGIRQQGPGGPGRGTGDPGRGSGPTVETPTGPNQFGLSSPTPGGWIGRGLGALPSAARGGHQGRDWMVPEGTTVGAPDDIKVIRAGNFGPSAGYGIEFMDSQGVVHKYFHLKEDPNTWLKRDSTGNYLPVGRGTRIGTVGRTGNAAGGPAHVHIETRRKGKMIDPASVYWPGYGTGTTFVPKDQMDAQKRSGTLQQNFKGLSGRASFFDDKTTASGLDPSVPGFAMRSSGTMGQRFVVRDEKTGKEIIATQTDWGPHTRTGRVIDINRALAKMFGYSEKNFPTDSTFSIRPLDSELNKSGAAGKSSQRSGNVKATVDFGRMKRQQMANQNPFKPLKLSTGRQNESVHAGSVLPGDMEHSRWTV